MPKLTISIALCSCNGEKYIREQLDSIAAQTHPPDELVVRDDASTDRTIDIVNSFASAAPFPVRLIVNEHRLGSTKNFEKAIEDCGGDLIFLADQDDLWMKDKLAIISDVFVKQPEVDVAFSDAELVNADLQPLGTTQWQSVRFFEKERRQMSSGNAMQTLVHHNVVQGAAMAFRSRVRGRILPIPADGMHDAWIALIVGVAGVVKPIPMPLLLYRQHGGNQLGSYDESGLLGKATSVMRADRARHTAAIYSTLRMYEQLNEHLNAVGVQSTPDRIFDLGGKVRHLRCRLHIVQRRFLWFFLWMRELFFMRYRGYSVGLWSAGYDLLQGTLRPSKGFG